MCVPAATYGEAESPLSGAVSILSGMVKGTEAAKVSPDPDRLLGAAREARNDAAPFALAAAGILMALALVSRHAHWDLLGHRLWWMWLLVAAPYFFCRQRCSWGWAASSAMTAGGRS